MSKLGQWFHRFLKEEDGPTAVEYAVMLALILVACITIVTNLGRTVSAPSARSTRRFRAESVHDGPVGS